MQVIEAVNARPLSLGDRDLQAEFDDAEAAAPIWGQDAAGTIVDDANAPAPHERYVHIESLGVGTFGLPTSRIVRDDIGVNLFGAGQDLQTFSDASDIYAAVDLRLGADSAAWMGIRATPFIVGNEVESYLIELQRNPDGTTSAVARYYSVVDRFVIAEVVLADPLPEWNHLEAVAVRDQIGFFVNGQFIASVSEAKKFGGTVVLGVDTGSADFDSLLIRDAKP